MVSKDSKLIFLTPPKTASNSLRGSLTLSSKIRFNNFDPSYPKPNTHLYLSELVENFKIDNIDEYQIIQIYRNPFEKFRSAFYHFQMLVPSNFKVTKMNLNEFVLHYKDCINSEDYINCMYDEPNYVHDLIKRRINFGCTRYFVEQHKWNDLNKNVIYLDITKIDELSNIIGVEIPKIGRDNIFLGEKENFSDFSLDILSKIYEKDFELIKNPQH